MSDCFEYSYQDDSWNAAKPMLEGRALGAAVQINGTHWWIVGGYTDSLYHSNSTEMFEEGKGFKVSGLIV